MIQTSCEKYQISCNAGKYILSSKDLCHVQHNDSKGVYALDDSSSLIVVRVIHYIAQFVDNCPVFLVQEDLCTFCSLVVNIGTFLPAIYTAITAEIEH